MKIAIKKAMDLIYNANGKLKEYTKKYPEDTVVTYGACKGIRLESEADVARGLHWSTARRALLILTDKRLSLGNWEIDTNSVEKSQLMLYRSGMILKITEKDGQHYQFGLQYDKALLEQEVLEIEVIKSKVKHSFLGLFLRGLVLFFLVKMILEMIK